jgi:hypothetical protein
MLDVVVGLHDLFNSGQRKRIVLEVKVRLLNQLHLSVPEVGIEVIGCGGLHFEQTLTGLDPGSWSLRLLNGSVAKAL